MFDVSAPSHLRNPARRPASTTATLQAPPLRLAFRYFTFFTGGIVSQCAGAKRIGVKDVSTTTRRSIAQQLRFKNIAGKLEGSPLR
jgi:hypothetical protein